MDTNVSEEHAASILTIVVSREDSLQYAYIIKIALSSSYSGSEDGDNIVLRNVGTVLADDTIPHPRTSSKSMYMTYMKAAWCRERHAVCRPVQNTVNICESGSSSE
jgi:hypothetical protein